MARFEILQLDGPADVLVLESTRWHGAMPDEAHARRELGSRWDWTGDWPRTRLAGMRADVARFLDDAGTEVWRVTFQDLLDEWKILAGGVVPAAAGRDRTRFTLVGWAA